MNAQINGETRLIGLLGYPLKHSFSPAMQNAAFLERGFNKLYLPIEVKEENLGEVVKGMAGMNFEGFNVTIPHKISIMKYLDEIDETARIIGAVNTVTIREGRLKGYNTDGKGFIRSFQTGLGKKVQGTKFLILGSGGAARAISISLALQEAGKVYICNRTYAKAQALTEEINQKINGRLLAAAVKFADLAEIMPDVEVIINTTSIGMYPETDDMPLDKELLEKRFSVCDIVYNPIRTKLLIEAEAIGCKILTGISMLVYQGAEAFQLWTGAEAPVETMFKELNSILPGMKNK